MILMSLKDLPLTQQSHKDEVRLFSMALVYIRRNIHTDCQRHIKPRGNLHTKRPGHIWTLGRFPFHS